MSNPEGEHSLNELKSALSDLLEQRKILPHMRGRIRQVVSKQMIDQTPQDSHTSFNQVQILLHSMIKDYMNFSGYNHAASIFSEESEQGAEVLDRAFVAKSLGIHQTLYKAHPNVPLVYSLVEHTRKEFLDPQTRKMLDKSDMNATADQSEEEGEQSINSSSTSSSTLSKQSVLEVDPSQATESSIDTTGLLSEAGYHSSDFESDEDEDDKAIVFSST